MAPSCVVRLFLLLLLFAAQAFGQDPILEKVEPDSGAVGDPIVLTGQNFGTETGSVTFKGKVATTTQWTDTSIIAVVPSGAGSGEVVVTVGDKASKGKAFVLTTPEFDQSAFEVLTGVGAVLSGLESTSYKVDSDNNALSQTNVGRKTVELLLGGGFILPWHAGGGWIERSFCGTPEEIAAAKKAAKTKKPICKEGGDPAYKNYRPWETFLSIRFAPASDQTINGFVIGGGYRITKYFSVLVGYSLTPVDEPTHGFRVTASQTVAANPTISPYNNFNASDLL